MTVFDRKPVGLIGTTRMEIKTTRMEIKMADMHPVCKTGGNHLPKVLPQVTIDQASLIPRSEMLNVLMENEHGIPIAQADVHRSVWSEPKNLGRSYLGFNNGVPSRMHKQFLNFPSKDAKLSNAAGVSVVELLVVMLIVAGLTTLALISFQKSTRSFKLSGATRNLSAYLEKARVNSVRRHGGANVVIDSTTSFTANIDFSGTGTLNARTIDLPAGTSLSYSLPPATTNIDPSATPITITYDWRGRTSSTVLLKLTDSIGGITPSTVIVGPAGDLSTDTTVTGPVTTPTPQNTTVTTTTGIKSMQ